MAKQETKTGGREATTGVIPGRWALSVGNPKTGTPSGFSWVRLTDVARLESGHTPSRQRPEYWDGKIPWVGIRDATANHGRTIYSTNQTITESGLANSSARLLPAGTVCLSRTASVGYVVTMGVPMATSQDFVNWVCGSSISPKLLHYILMGEQNSIRRFAHGTTHQTVYYPEAKAFHVLIPERIEQDRIADLLGALDNKIAANEQIATSTYDLVAEMLEATILNIGSAPDWADVPLGSIVNVNARKVKPTLGGSLRYIDISSVSPGRLIWPELSSWETAPSRARRGVSRGDVLWSTVRPNRRSHVLVLHRDQELVASTGFAVLTPVRVGYAYLYAVTTRSQFVEHLVSVAEGSAYPAVRAERFAEAVVPLPPQDVLTRFEATAAAMFDRAHASECESRTLASLRDTLLPKLISGELRVKDAEKQVEEVV